jgi:hypothetical protein
MTILIISPDIVDKLRSIEFPKGNSLDPISGNLNGEDMFWLPADLRGATYTDNDGNEQPLYKEVLADFDACDSKDIDTIEDKYYDTSDNEILPSTTVTVTTTTKTITDAQGQQTVETDPVGDPVEDIEYYDSNNNKLNIFDLKHRTILTESVVQVGSKGIINNVVTYVSDRVTDVINGISWVWDNITGWFKS